MRRLAALCVFLALTNAASAQDLSGRWPSGYWDDVNSGHTGKLRGNFHKIDDSHYRVTFTGTFWKVIPFRYSVTLDVVGYEGDKVILSGESRIPLSGTYHYQAEATPCSFVANYCSRKYQGKFVLER